MFISQNRPRRPFRPQGRGHQLRHRRRQAHPARHRKVLQHARGRDAHERGRPHLRKIGRSKEFVRRVAGKQVLSFSELKERTSINRERKEKPKLDRRRKEEKQRKKEQKGSPTRPPRPLIPLNLKKAKTRKTEKG